MDSSTTLWRSMTGTAGFSVYPVGQQAAAQWVQTKYQVAFKSFKAVEGLGIV